MKDDRPDLTFVDPHRRGIVAARIEAVKRFNRNPGRRAAEREARALGISAGRFYLVVKAWNTYRNASRLPGANRHRMDARVPASICDEIAQLLADDPDIIPERANEKVRAFAASMSIAPPSAPTIAEELRRQRGGRIAKLEQNMNYAVDHCHLAIPVRGSLGLAAATFSSLIDTKHRRIIGASLTEGAPDLRSTARAIADAVRSGRLDAEGTILIDRPDAGDWARLAAMLTAAGFNVVGERLELNDFDHDRGVMRKRGNGRMLRAVAGRYIAGYPMMVRTRGSRRMPDPVVRAGAEPLPIEQAERLVRSRLASGDTETGPRLRVLARELEDLAASL